MPVFASVDCRGVGEHARPTNDRDAMATLRLRLDVRTGTQPSRFTVLSSTLAENAPAQQVGAARPTLGIARGSGAANLRASSCVCQKNRPGRRRVGQSCVIDSSSKTKPPFTT